MPPDAFRLTLFSTDASIITQAVAAGVDALIVDWEHIGKAERQLGADTQINYDTLDDLRRVRAVTSAANAAHQQSARVLCRVNAPGPTTAAEIEAAAAAGADEILLPMVRRPGEAEAALRYAAGQCGVGILVETVEAIACAPDLAALPLTRVYIGLNDLAIARGSPSIFAPLADGTLERLRGLFGQPFGFGGLTLPDRGEPLPCRLLIAEMARLGCSFSFLRRSFLRDMAGRAFADEVPRLKEAIADAQARPAAAVARDRQALDTALRALIPAGTGLRS